MDRYDSQTRSFVMSRIRGRDTNPELLLRKELWTRGLRGYRTQSRLPGRPDLAFKRFRLAIFVDGCFWHGCPKCRIAIPVSRVGYWRPKLRNNKRRDKRVNKELRAQNWRVLRFWEHEVMNNLERCARRVLSAIKSTKRHKTWNRTKRRERGQRWR